MSSSLRLSYLLRVDRVFFIEGAGEGGMVVGCL